MTYYQLLGIAKDATAEEIRKAYLAKAARLHPDRFAGAKETEEETRNRNRQFKEVGEAYAVLSDARARYRYDRAIRVPQGLADLLATPHGQRAMARLLPRAPKQSRNGEDLVVIAQVPAATLVTGGAIVVAPTDLPNVFEALFFPPNANKTPWARLPDHGEPGENGGIAGDLFILLVPTDR